MDKFSAKDYINYVFSGVVWIGLFYYVSIVVTKFTGLNVKFLEINSNEQILSVLSIAFIGYIVGNIMRPTDNITSILTTKVWGDLYCQALYHDREELSKSNVEKLGLKFKYTKKKTKCLSKTISEEIEKKIAEHSLNRKSKLNQFIMIETYLSLKEIPIKLTRLKDLKNLMESLFVPIILIILTYFIDGFIGNRNLILLIAGMIISLSISSIMLSRYKYLKSNYIKESYRMLLFLEHLE